MSATKTESLQSIHPSTGWRLPPPDDRSGWFAVVNGCWAEHNKDLMDVLDGAPSYPSRDWLVQSLHAGLLACRGTAPTLQIGLFSSNIPPEIDQQVLTLTSDLHTVWAAKHGMNAALPANVRQSWVPVCYVDGLEGVDVSRAWVIAHEKMPEGLGALVTLSREEADPARLRDLSVSRWPEKIVVLSRDGDVRPNTASCADALMGVPAVVGSIQALRDVRFADWSGAINGCWLPARTSAHDGVWAEQSGLPSFGFDTDLFQEWGTKEGNHKLFRLAGVPRPEGTEDLVHTQDALLDAIDAFILRTGSFKVVAKASDNASGMGNAMLDFSPLKPLFDDKDTMPAMRKDAMLRCLCENAHKNYVAGDAKENLTFDDYVRNIVARGGVVLEAFIHAPVGGRTYDASVQFIVSPIGSGRTSDVVGIHKPVVTESGVYNGAFAPPPQYLEEMLREIGQKVGVFLHEKGLAGPMGIDVFIQEGPMGIDGKPSFVNAFCVDANLRQPGTLHGLHLRSITEQVLGIPLSSTSTDSYHPPIGLTRADIVAVAESDAFRFNPETGTGVSLHLVSNVDPYNKLGFSCLAPADLTSQTEPFGPARDLEIRFKKALEDRAGVS